MLNVELPGLEQMADGLFYMQETISVAVKCYTLFTIPLKTKKGPTATTVPALQYFC